MLGCRELALVRQAQPSRQNDLCLDMAPNLCRYRVRILSALCRPCFDLIGSCLELMLSQEFFDFNFGLCYCSEDIKLQALLLIEDPEVA